MGVDAAAQVFSTCNKAAHGDDHPSCWPPACRHKCVAASCPHEDLTTHDRWFMDCLMCTGGAGHQPRRKGNRVRAEKALCSRCTAEQGAHLLGWMRMQIVLRLFYHGLSLSYSLACHCQKVGGCEQPVDVLAQIHAAVLELSDRGPASIASSTHSHQQHPARMPAVLISASQQSLLHAARCSSSMQK